MSRDYIPLFTISGALIVIFLLFQPRLLAAPILGLAAASSGGATLRWPFDKRYNIIGNFGPRIHPLTGLPDYHTGIDIDAPMDSLVLSCHNGIVDTVSSDERNGNYVIVKGSIYAVSYVHLHQAKVKVGDRVMAGDVIGMVGKTGWATGPHLHLTVRLNGIPVNPEALLPKSGLL